MADNYCFFPSFLRLLGEKKSVKQLQSVLIQKSNLWGFFVLLQLDHASRILLLSSGCVRDRSEIQMATVGPFEKHHCPPAAVLPQHRRRSQRDTGSSSTLCRARASPFQQLTNHSGACWVVLGPWTSSNIMNALETQDNSHTAPTTGPLSGGADQFSNWRE